MFIEIRKEYLKTDEPCPLAMVLCNIGQSEMQGAIMRPEGFHFHHVLWVEKGEGLFWVNGQQRTLGPGEGLFCKKNVPHGYERTGDTFSTRWVTFLGGEGVMDYYHAPDAFFFRCSKRMEESTIELDSLCQGSSTVLSRSAAGYTWLSQWLSDVFDAQQSVAANVQRYLEAHFARALTLEEIGASVGLDRFTLCRQYRETTGVTVMEQLKRIRVAKAKQFLRYTSYSIEEIGVLCGYDSPSYFGKIFKDETGRTPRAYREQHRGR